jgi:hypothetical protein
VIKLGLAFILAIGMAFQGTAVLADSTDSTVNSTVADAPAVATAPTVAVLGDVPILNKIQIDFTPYVWLPTLNGTFRYRTTDIATPGGIPLIIGAVQSFDQRVGPSSYLSKINFALMGRLVVHVGPLGFYGDVINANLSNQSATNASFSGPLGGMYTVGASGGGQVVTTLISAAPTVTLFHALGTRVDFLAGGQWLTLSANANVQLTGPLGNTFTAGAGRSETYGDFIAGFKGEIGLAPHLSLPFLADAGFGTPTSYQLLGGIKYGNLSLAWRYLQFNAGSSTALVQRLTLGGPILGYTIPF